jgi:hypothetical protein
MVAYFTKILRILQAKLLRKFRGFERVLRRDRFKPLEALPTPGIDPLKSSLPDMNLHLTLSLILIFTFYL